MYNALEFHNTFTSHGSDKEQHGYGIVYKDAFKDFDKESQFKIIEIGILFGASIRALSELFPNARILGMDINQHSGLVTSSFSKNVNILFADSTKRQIYSHYREQYFKTDYDIIIDDGEHSAASQIATFYNCRNKFKKCYIIEDILGDDQYEDLSKMITSLGFKFDTHVSTRYDNDPPCRAITIWKH
jgi:hypothetical protein